MQRSKDALADMPPRDESELDPVTLHNQALIVRDSDCSLSAVAVPLRDEKATAGVWESGERTRSPAKEMDEKPTEGFRKLNFLLNQQPSPPALRRC